MFVGLGDKAKRNRHPLFLGSSGYLGIAAHTLKELVISQFQKWLSAKTVQLHLWSIVDTKFVGDWTVCVQIRL